MMRNATEGLGLLVLCSLLAGLQPQQALPQQRVEVSTAGLERAPTKRDGQHDFDFEMGSWRTKLKRLQRPLTGSTIWVEYEGTTVVRKVWDGRANLAELEVEGPAGRIEGLSLRLYNPESRQWSLNFSNSAGGTLSPSAIDEFKNGRGEFFSQEHQLMPMIEKYDVVLVEATGGLGEWQ